MHIGAGYVNELIARLNGTAVLDNTSTNHTLDDSTSTFPLDRPLYADFTHDLFIVAVLNAIGLFNDYDSQGPDPLHKDPRRTFNIAHIVPFAARVVTERLQCGSETRVRILVNDRPQPLPMCTTPQSHETVCKLEDFIGSQGYSRHRAENDWPYCAYNPPE